MNRELPPVAALVSRWSHTTMEVNRQALPSFNAVFPYNDFLA
jgi:hypothetical protein